MTIIQGDGFEVKIIRSRRRKSLSLQISHEGATIRMPHTLALREAEAFVDKKSRWIKQKLAQATPPLERQYSIGGTHAYLGENYPLVHIPHAGKAALSLADNQLQLHSKTPPTPEAIKRLLINWYRQQADNHITLRTQHFADIMALQPTKISTRTYKARWGSCNARGEVQFNWQLIQAPIEVIDYVIIHELSHLKHLNHSADFWQQVDQYYPNYKTARLWFKQYGAQLLL
jgi:predicted metal-dependent hydrolase